MLLMDIGACFCVEQEAILFRNGAPKGHGTAQAPCVAGAEGDAVHYTLDAGTKVVRRATGEGARSGVQCQPCALRAREHASAAT